MAFVLANRVRVVSSTSGLSNFTLGSAAGATYQTFSGAGVPSGSTVHYVALTATQFETGQGTYNSSGPTLSRDTIFDGTSGAGVKVNFSSNPTIFVGPIAQTFAPTYGIMRERLFTDTTIDVPGDFSTIQDAWDYAQNSLDLNGYILTFQLADGTYTAGLDARGGLVGATGPESVIIKGNAGTPANVVFSGAGAFFTLGLNQTTTSGVAMTIKDLKFSGSNYGFIVSGAALNFGNINFGAMFFEHIHAQHNAWVFAESNYAVSGGAGVGHVAAATNSIVALHGRTITFSNSPGIFTFATAIGGAGLYMGGMTFTNGGTVTGIRYTITTNAFIDTVGGGASYIPGSVAGSTASGGQYV